MKKVLFLCASLLVGSQGLKAQVPEPVLGVNFNSNGIVLSGIDAGNHTFGSKGSTVLYNSHKNNYLGCTSNNTNSYYWVKYDADDALGTAFATECTWEFLFRMDKQEGYNYTTITYDNDNVKSVADQSTGTTKFFSSQEDGGWSFYNYSNSGIRLAYVTQSATSTSTNNVQLLTTGKFYHVIATVNKTTNKLNLYVNGKQVVKDFAVNSSALKFPNAGSSLRKKGMWFCFGGDISNPTIGGTKSEPIKQGLDEPGAHCEGSAATTWVYANFYNKSISAEEAKSLYTEEVKWYTEPKKPAVSDLIVDAIFENSGGIHDASPYNMQLDKIGTPTTQYNSNLRRYELTHGTDNTSSNIFYTYYGTTPSITSQMADAFSWEFYAKAEETRTVNISAISSYQGGGWGNHISKDNKNFPMTFKTYGYHAAGENATSGKSWTASAKSWSGMSTATNELETSDYAHYVCVFDRNNIVQRVYKNGNLILDCADEAVKTYAALTPLDNLEFPVSHNQWFGIGGDANSTNGANSIPTACDFPWQGQIAIARIWGKALTENDAQSLNNQARSLSKTITTDTEGYATLCVPFAATLPTGLTAYVIKTQDASSVKLIKLADAGETIGNGQPVILKGTASTNYTLNAAEVNVVTNLKRVKSLLDGSYINKEVTAGQVYKLTNGQLVKCSAETIPANTAFLPYTEGGANTKSLSTSSFSDGTILLDINFTKDGIVNNGAEQHDCKAYLYRNVNAATTVYDAKHDKYMGATAGDNQSYFYVKYDKADEVGQAFENAATWEFLFRPDGLNHVANKVFSSQDAGGWTFQNCPNNMNGVRFSYVTSAATTSTSYSPTVTGNFYHVVASMNKSTNEIIFYVNGKKVGKTISINSANYQHPNCGTIRRIQDMWMTLGGDPAGQDTPGACQEHNRTTFVFARIYKGAMTEVQMKALYTNEIKEYTEPQMPNTQDLLLDVVYDKNNNAHDASVWNKLGISGTLKTQYNQNLKRYESVTQTNRDFLYRDYKDEPMFTKQMGNVISLEVFCNPTSTTLSGTNSPLSAQQSTGGMGIEFQKDNNIKFNINSDGYSSSAWVSGTDGFTAKATLNAVGYKHYVAVYDRLNKTTALYINGVLDNSNTWTLNDQFKFCFAPYQWFAIGGDASYQTTAYCDFPYNGQIATARIWAKALTAEDAQTLYAQATATQETVNIDEYKYITRIFPFAAVVPAGLKAYVVESANGSVQLTEYATEGDVIPYGTPVILGSETTGNYTLEAADLTSATIKPAPATNLLEGSFASKDAAADGDMYILAVDNCQLVFAPVQGSTSITAQRAWLPKSVVKLAAAAKAMPIMAPGVTGVNGAKVSTSKENTYYDIQGRKVTNPTRGLYIKNGQKIWVK